MIWWAWLVLGIGLLVVEMFVIDAQFYLVFIGLSAAIVGLAAMVGLDLAPWAQWLLFSGLAIIAMLAFRRRLYERVRGRTGHVEERLTVGERLAVDSRLEPGQSGRVDYCGTTWTARNVGTSVIEAGREARIVQVDGLVLHVRKD